VLRTRANDPQLLALFLGEFGTSHLVARQELRALVASLRLPIAGRAAPATSEAA